MRHLVANNLKLLIKNQYRNSKNTIKEWNTIKSIKQKLTDNNSVVTQTDKGKAIVILYKQDYDKYIEAFISNNNFELINKDLTNTYPKRIKESVN
jgi:primosomal protein N'